MEIKADITAKKQKRVIVKGSENDYVADKETCTCPAYCFRGICKHIIEVEKMPVEFKKVSEGIVNMKSSIEGLNEKFGGALYTSDEIVADYGKPGVCKSLFNIQESFNFAASGKNVLYIDTEGGVQSQVNAWYDVFDARFKPKGKMFIDVKKSLSALTEFLGFKTVTEYVCKNKKEGKGKMEFRVVESTEKAPIDVFIKENKIHVVILDSLTSPIRQAMVDEQQNNPAKASATALICGKLLRMQDDHKVAVIITAHAMFNPADPYQTMATMRGGVVIQHYSKRILYFDARDKGDLKSFRRVWIARGENTAKFDQLVGMKIDDSGFKEVPYEDLLTDTEKGKLGIEVKEDE